MEVLIDVQLSAQVRGSSSDILQWSVLPGPRCLLAEGGFGIRLAVLFGGWTFSHVSCLGGTAKI